jgi:hypothetical protein
LRLAAPDVHLIEERVRVHWGDFSQVAASLNLIKAALALEPPCARFVLLSGADFPLQSSDYIERFFTRNARREYISAVPIPSPDANKPLSRMTRYHLSGSSPRLLRLMKKACLQVGLLPATRDYARHLEGLAPWGGSSWWALSREACEYIMTFVDRNPALVRFFHNTFCPDESFFQTILSNSPLRERIARSLTFADWSAGGANPAFLSEKHLELLNELPVMARDRVYGTGEMLFARKFRDGDADLARKFQQRHP